MTRLFVLTLLGLSAALVSVQAADWEKLGDRLVSFGTDRDTIKVGARDGTFTKIKLAVRRNGVRLLDVKIHFANGEVQDVKLRKFIKAGGQTRVIDLPGRNRVIEKVTLTYKSGKNRKNRALVELWGR